MAARSPARFLAPLALLAVAAALWLIVSHTSSNEGSGSNTEHQSTATPASKSGAHHRKKHAKRFYTVKPGDTPSGIAQKTGVPLSKIERLNPDLDPQALSPGTRLKLRR